MDRCALSHPLRVARPAGHAHAAPAPTPVSRAPRPYAPLRVAVTARAGLPVERPVHDTPLQAATEAQDEPDAQPRPVPAISGPLLLARIYESQVQGWACVARRGCTSSRLLCTGCGRQADADHRLRHRGGLRSTHPRISRRAHNATPPIASARGPPHWEEDIDPRKGTNAALNDSLPEYEFDQRVSG